MVYKQSARSATARESNLDEVFFALSHVARRQLLVRLGKLGDQFVAPLAAPLSDSPAQITKHLAILERAGLVSRQVDGRKHRLHLESDGIRPAIDWIRHHKKFWTDNVDQLEEFLDSFEGEAR
jgi:DNA-binding transcriptional ArsR family regulator